MQYCQSSLESADQNPACAIGLCPVGTQLDAPDWWLSNAVGAVVVAVDNDDDPDENHNVDEVEDEDFDEEVFDDDEFLDDDEEYDDSDLALVEDENDY